MNPNTVEEIAPYLDSLFSSKDGIWPKDSTPAFCQTGETYTEIVSGRVWRKGSDEIEYAETEQEAVHLWLKAFDTYAKGKTGTLYWRIRPELGRNRHGKFAVYGRLIITDKLELSQIH